MNTRKRITLGFAAAVLASGLVTVPTAVASAQPSSDVTASATKCTGWKSAQLKGNPAGMKYKECRRTYRGRTQSSGAIYLWDNRHDGKSACGRIDISKWKHTWCWGNESKHSPMYISGWHNGTDAQFHLFLA
ncbi:MULTISPECIES: hypothetical protein [unclassified Streptomyces]|uniref:hypothetical protein n=1 Tax=unclassified Streptomyces TaxID=2593676 RepID=UPI002E1A8093|nr:hypothetical protein OG217_03510 [Streptomyces sp. NBC_01023]